MFEDGCGNLFSLHQDTPAVLAPEPESERTWSYVRRGGEDDALMCHDLIVEYKQPILPMVLGASRGLFADGSSCADITRTDDLRRDGEPWWGHARCNDGDGGLVDVFFSGALDDIARAKRLCMSCPVLVPCLEGALERREPWGVWGGQLFLDGRIVATKRRRGRPPKMPRPGDRFRRCRSPSTSTLYRLRGHRGGTAPATPRGYPPGGLAHATGAAVAARVPEAGDEYTPAAGVNNETRLATASIAAARTGPTCGTKRVSSVSIESSEIVVLSEGDA